jgi:TIR domain
LSASAAPKVFISYRREETAGHAGRLYDVMSSRFGHANVFMDVDMAPGVDFVERIKAAVGGCHVLLVIIGPRWSTITNGSIAPRLADPGDFVRLEVEEGLRCADVNVIPVLVGGARMPGPSELPKELHPLSRRNALELSDSRWRYDVDRLLGALDRLLAGTSAVTPRPGAMRAVSPPAAAPAPTREPTARAVPALRGVPLAITATIVGVAAAAAGRGLANRFRWNPDDKLGKILQPVSLTALTWAIVAAAVAVWVAFWMRRRSAALGFLWIGALIGAGAGALNAAIANVPKHAPTNPPSTTTLGWIAMIGLAVGGALLGALVGWVWARRGSAGFSAGLAGGAIVGIIARHWQNASNRDRVSHAVIEILFIVGVSTLAQAALDASERRAA